MSRLPPQASLALRLAVGRATDTGGWSLRSWRCWQAAARQDPRPRPSRLGQGTPVSSASVPVTEPPTTTTTLAPPPPPPPTVTIPGDRAAAAPTCLEKVLEVLDDHG